jgi:hypothetical protein
MGRGICCVLPAARHHRRRHGGRHAPTGHATPARRSTPPRTGRPSIARRPSHHRRGMPHRADSDVPIAAGPARHRRNELVEIKRYRPGARNAHATSATRPDGDRRPSPRAVGARPKTETRRQRYFNLWLMLWKTMYRLGDMTEEDLRLTLRRDLFPAGPDAFGQRLWQRSRDAYLTNVRGRRAQRFFEIVDDEYRKSTGPAQRTPYAAVGRIGSLLRRRPEALIVGGIVGAAACRVLTHAARRRGSRRRRYS